MTARPRPAPPATLARRPLIGADVCVERVRTVLADDGLSVRCFTPEQVTSPIDAASGDPDLRRVGRRRPREPPRRVEGAMPIAAAGARRMLDEAGAGILLGDAFRPATSSANPPAPLTRAPCLA